MKGCCLHYRKRYGQAVANFEKFLSLNPTEENMVEEAKKLLIVCKNKPSGSSSGRGRGQSNTNGNNKDGKKTMFRGRGVNNRSKYKR